MKKTGVWLFLLPRGSVRDDFDAQAAGARTVEFAEEDSLPGAEFELASANKNGGGTADERRLDVRVGVAFGVAVAGILRNHARKRGLNIGGDVRIGVLIDEHAGGGVRNVHVADARLHAGILHHFGDARGDVEQLGAPFRAHGEFAGGGVARFG